MKFLLVALAVIGLTAAVPTKSLKDDLDEFLALIPVDKIRVIARKYVDTDAEVQHALGYLQSSEWQALVQEVASKQAVKDLKSYLTSAGINIDAIIKAIHDFIQNVHPNPKGSARGLRQFLDEIKATIPVGDLLVLLNDKLSNSDDFIAFFEKISSEDTHKLVEEVRALTEVQRLAEKLKTLGLDPTRVLELIYGFLGWE